MRYSVWNNANRAYDYYEAQGEAGIHAGAPPRAASSSLGATPDQAAWPLPEGARRVGTGELPQGRIASLDGGNFRLDIPQALFWGAAGYLLYRTIK